MEIVDDHISVGRHAHRGPVQAEKILIADDYAGLRGLLRIVLEQRGHKVVMAENGPATLDAFLRHNPSLVVLDLHMPGMDGFDLLGQLHELNPEVRIIVLSGADMESARGRALALGASAVFQKGCSLIEVADHVDRVGERYIKNEER